MRTIITQMTVCADGDSPIVSDTAIHIGMDDQGAGPYLTFRGTDTQVSICVDVDEWPTVAATVEKMLAEIRKAERKS